jgi:hypothetical protein
MKEEQERKETAVRRNTQRLESPVACRSIGRRETTKENLIEHLFSQ